MGTSPRSLHCGRSSSGYVLTYVSTASVRLAVAWGSQSLRARQYTLPPARKKDFSSSPVIVPTLHPETRHFVVEHGGMLRPHRPQPGTKGGTVDRFL